MPDPYTYTPPDALTAPTLPYRISAAWNALFGKVAQPKPSSIPTTAKAEPEQPASKTQDDPSGRGFPDANYVQTMFRTWQELFYGSTQRIARYRAYDEMDTGQIAAMLDAVVDACLVSDDGQLVGFKVEGRGAKIQTVIDHVNEQTNLKFEIRFILRNLLKYGDLFFMPVLDEYSNIVDYETPPPGQVYKFVDQHMRLLTGTEEVVIGNRKVSIPKAYQQKTNAMQSVAGWYAWECLHLQWLPSKNTIYSTKSFLEDIRSDYTKLKLTEEALLWHRITRSSPRNLHLLDMTGKTTDEARSDIEAYIEGLRTEKMADGSSQEHIMSVKEDYVLATGYRPPAPDGKLYPSLSKMEMFDPRGGGLQTLPDIEHLVRKIFSRIPSELVGILPDRNDISSQDIAAARLYAYCQFILSENLLRPVYNLALALRGFVPERDDFKIVFPNIQMRASWRSADSRFRDSLASGNEIEQGIISRKAVSKNRYSFTDAEWEEEKKEILKEREEFAPPEPASTLAPKAPTAKAKDPNKVTNNKGKVSKVTQMRKGHNSESLLAQAKEEVIEEILGTSQEDSDDPSHSPE